MTINIEGGTQAYAVTVTAAYCTEGNVSVVHSKLMIPANSEVEAEGYAMRAAHQIFPDSKGWRAHHATCIRFDQVTSLKPLNIHLLIPEPIPA